MCHTASRKRALSNLKIDFFFFSLHLAHAHTNLVFVQLQCFNSTKPDVRKKTENWFICSHCSFSSFLFCCWLFFFLFLIHLAMAIGNWSIISSIISHSDQSKSFGLIRALWFFCVCVCVLTDYVTTEKTNEQFHSYRIDYFSLWLKKYFICSYFPFLFLFHSIKLTNKQTKQH